MAAPDLKDGLFSPGSPKKSYAAPQKFQDAITVQVGQHKKK